MRGAVYLLDKSAGVTSRRAASAVASAWGFRKYGHAGTLDPDATGLLIVLLGKATRLARFLQDSIKRYDFMLHLGMVTDTDDITGTVLKENPVPEYSRKDILNILKRYTGTFQQKVPAYSAVRIRGERAHRIARRGDVPDTPSREVTASDWTLGEIEEKNLRLQVSVSTGTYVRALARDIGCDLGTGGTASAIRRISSGCFNVREASGTNHSPESLLTMSHAMREYPAVRLDSQEEDRVRHGMKIPGSGMGITSLLDPGGELLAVYRGDGEWYSPECVLTGGGS